MGRPKGLKLSEETKLKMSEAKKGKLPKNFLKMQKLAWEKNKTLLKEKNPNWKGGKPKGMGGYILNRIGIENYKFEHRLVMEKYIGKQLDSNEIIHHINGNITDNRIENLQIVDRAEHARIHLHKDLLTGKFVKV